MVVSRILWIFVFISFCVALTVSVHVGVKLANSKRATPKGMIFAHAIAEPALPNCSEPICTGPLENIYCSGKLIHSSWMFGMQEKCPGDMMRFSPDRVIAEFNKLKYPMQREEFTRFCVNNFADISYLKPVELDDWVPDPENVRKLKDQSLRNFTSQLNGIWKTLGREFVSQVKDTPDRFPVLAVPNPFVVPGGLFQIYFYWDSYWILKGLLFSSMTRTVHRMIENFASVIQYHGFIPNSGSIQLARRSQPPLFTQMVADYFNVTRNVTFLNEMIPYIESELAWWLNNRSTVVQLSTGNHTLFVYKTITNCPRPENYLVDLNNGVNGTGSAQFTWSSITSACESGLDFSSRWFAYRGKQAGTKFSIRTNGIIPVDLNVFMVWNYKSIAEFLEIVNQSSKAEKYRDAAAQLRSSIEAVLWNEEDGAWFDYDVSGGSQRRRFYPSNVFPLLLGDSKHELAEKVLQYIIASDVLQYKGGIPSTLDEKAHEQWDFPNGWAPSIHLFVESLRRSKHARLIAIAKTVADKFIRTVYNGLMNPSKGMTPACWEKYDVRYDDGRPGIGGEYPVQQGFGWTNGAVLDMIFHFYGSSGQLFPHFAKKEYTISPMKDFDGLSHSYVFVALAMLFCIILATWFAIRAVSARSARSRTTSRLFAGSFGSAEESLLISDVESD